jgi:hypothetical protein
MKDNLLKNWKLQQTWDGSFVLIGAIYNDAKERFADGAEIRTSALRKIDFVNGFAETRNTVYTLERKIPL